LKIKGKNVENRTIIIIFNVMFCGEMIHVIFSKKKKKKEKKKKRKGYYQLKLKVNSLSCFHSSKKHSVSGEEHDTTPSCPKHSFINHLRG
jgi:hypothetical protein